MNAAALYVLVLIGVPAYLIYLFASWAYRDGESRGKSGWLVILLVLTGPVGLLAWLTLRPEVISYPPMRSRPIVGPGTAYEASTSRSRIVDVAREKGSLLG
jgi:hypothetical protein